MEDKRKAHVPIIALTGYSNDGKRREKCLKAGMQEVLSKPLQRLAPESVVEQFVFKTVEEGEVPLPKAKPPTIGKAGSNRNN